MQVTVQKTRIIFKVYKYIILKKFLVFLIIKIVNSLLKQLLRKKETIVLDKENEQVQNATAYY